MKAVTQPLPRDIKLMNACALGFTLVFVALVLVLVLSWVMNKPAFGVRAIRVQGDVLHNSAVTLRANVAPKLAGNLFSLDLTRARMAFESVPWVRHAVVQRTFPNQISVTLQEHKAVAYWSEQAETKLLNSFGEVFEANLDEVESEDLPTLAGPQGQSAEVLAIYQALLPIFEPLDAVPEHFELTGRGSWRARLDNGAVLELGRGSLDEIKARAQRFVATLPQLTAKFGRNVESADLRYSNGYALKLKGVTTVAVGDKNL